MLNSLTRITKNILRPDEIKVSTDHLVNVQILRGIAALGVVISHSANRFAREFPEESKTSIFSVFGGLEFVGHSGVDLFFVVSGFIMIYVHFGDFGNETAPRKFILRRIKRIVPIYWILTTLALALIVAMPQLSSHGRVFDLDWVLGSYFFVPVRSDTGVSTPVIGPGWTLNYEMYFYLLFAGCLFFKRQYVIPALTAIFVLSILIGEVTNPTTLLFVMLTSPLLLEFLAGCILGYTYRSGYRISRSPSVFLIMSGVALLTIWAVFGPSRLLSHQERVVYWGIPATLIFIGFVFGPISLSNIPLKILKPIGDASYSIYLTHILTLPALAILIKFSGFATLLPSDFWISVLLIGATIVGYVFYCCVERLIGRLLSGRPVLQPRSV